MIMKKDNIVHLEKILKALASKRRLDIVRFLGKRQATVGGIAEKIGLSFRSTSKHLAILYANGIVYKKPVGKNIFYGIAKTNNKIVSAILDHL